MNVESTPHIRAPFDDTQTLQKALRTWLKYAYDLSSSNGRTKSLVLLAEIRENSLVGSELVQETTNKVALIKEKLKATRDRQNSYLDNMRKHLEWKLVIKVMNDVIIELKVFDEFPRIQAMFMELDVIFA
uniref:Reverse transcriptase domain-containing protein n=1 Tax=Tanacetum cinerariifolium TaxID=118510 RepID=A0A6L2LX39_TANCI|nr:reverse transcriptase domain-containing protein [Tanacetum cinerariifolium]